MGAIFKLLCLFIHIVYTYALKGGLQLAKVGMAFSTKGRFWCKTNVFIQLRIMKNPCFDSIQNKLDCSIFPDMVQVDTYLIFQWLSWVPL